jgi:hypothetical protein
MAQLFVVWLWLVSFYFVSYSRVEVKYDSAFGFSSRIFRSDRHGQTFVFQDANRTKYAVDILGEAPDDISATVVLYVPGNAKRNDGMTTALRSDPRKAGSILSATILLPMVMFALFKFQASWLGSIMRTTTR